MYLNKREREHPPVLAQPKRAAVVPRRVQRQPKMTCIFIRYRIIIDRISHDNASPTYDAKFSATYPIILFVNVDSEYT